MNRWVYCLSEGSGEPVKIGVTQCVASRLSAAQGHTWRNIYLQWAVPGDDRHEMMLKRALRPLCIRNEWFQDPCDAIKGANAGDEWTIGGKHWPYKHEIFKAIRARDYAGWRHMNRSFEAAREERFYKYFNAEFRGPITELAGEVGIRIDPGLFRVRDDAEFNAVFATLAPSTPSEASA